MIGFTKVNDEAKAAHAKENTTQKSFDKKYDRVAFRNRFRLGVPGSTSDVYFLDTVNPKEYTTEQLTLLYCLGICLNTTPQEGWEIRWATKTKAGKDNWNNFLPAPVSPNFQLNPVTRLQLLKNTGGWNVLGKAIKESDDTFSLAKSVYVDPDQGVWTNLLSEDNFLRNKVLCNGDGYSWPDPITEVMNAKGPDGKPKFKVKPAVHPVYYFTVIDPQVKDYKRFDKEKDCLVDVHEENTLRLYVAASGAMPSMNKIIKPEGAIRRNKKWDGLAGYVCQAVRQEGMKSAAIGELKPGGDADMDEIRKLCPDAVIDLDVETIEARLREDFNFFWHLYHAATGVETPIKELAQQMAEVLGCDKEIKSYYHPANYLAICLPKLPGYYEKVFSEQLEMLESGVTVRKEENHEVVFGLGNFTPEDVD